MPEFHEPDRHDVCSHRDLKLIRPPLDLVWSGSYVRAWAKCPACGWHGLIPDEECQRRFPGVPTRRL
jgi:hypothetical protein